jgi:hypothetical protein
MGLCTYCTDINTRPPNTTCCHAIAPCKKQLLRSIRDGKVDATRNQTDMKRHQGSKEARKRGGEEARKEGSSNAGCAHRREAVLGFGWWRHHMASLAHQARNLLPHRVDLGCLHARKLHELLVLHVLCAHKASVQGHGGDRMCITSCWRCRVLSSPVLSASLSAPSRIFLSCERSLVSLSKRVFSRVALISSSRAWVILASSSLSWRRVSSSALRSSS